MRCGREEDLVRLRAVDREREGRGRIVEPDARGQRAEEDVRVGTRKNRLRDFVPFVSRVGDLDVDAVLCD